MKIVYIDSQNIHKAILEIGWKIDWEKFYKYLIDKYQIDKIKIFFRTKQKPQRINFETYMWERRIIALHFLHEHNYYIQNTPKSQILIFKKKPCTKK